MGMPEMDILWRDSGDESAYEKERVAQVFNAIKPDRYPKAIVKVTHHSHVREAIRLANKLRCRVSVKSGGHSWAGWGIREDAILLDLEGLNEIKLNKEQRIVTVSPSTTGKTLNEALCSEGLMFGGGHCPDVGLGGFLLQGGMGWNCKNWGWSCEKIVGLDVVTASGEALHCSETENADLLWCARGAGPGFPAIVTRFYLSVRPNPAVMYRSTYIYPISCYTNVLGWIVKVSPKSDPGNEIVAVGLTPKGRSEICIAVHIVTFQESESAACEALRPLDECRPAGALIEILSQATSLAAEYEDQTEANPSNHRYCVDNMYISNNADVIGVLEKAFTTLPNSRSFVLWLSMAPASRRLLPDMACSMQSDHYFALYAIWESAADDARCKEWVKSIMRDALQMSDGAYLGDSDFQVRKTKFWTDAAAEKLMRLRAKWDPNGIICGYLDEGDISGSRGLNNQNWVTN